MTRNDLTERVDFNIIRYANCWEDADVLLHGLSPAQGSRILSVGSAGDNSFSLLTKAPELVVAIDINKVQLFLIELKKICIQNFEREETIRFLGFEHSSRREADFDSIKNQLSAEARYYWESNRTLVINGIIHQGKFEKYFRLFSGKILPWIHSKKTVQELLESKSEEQQKIFYDKKWNSWRWRLLFKIFFSKYVMGKYGRDPEFHKQVEIPVSEFIFIQAEKQLSTIAAQENFILHYALTGNFGALLPHYLRKENYETIRSHIRNLHLEEGFAQSAVNEFGKFGYMNLSNIFEYMDKGLFEKTAAELVDAIEKGGKIAYWNLMVPRRVSALFPEKVAYQEVISQQLTAIDKGFFYKEFILDSII